MQSFIPFKSLLNGLLLLIFVFTAFGCEKEPKASICVKGTVIGQGCITGSYAILLEGKNSDYNISENVAYDNVVETLNLPDEYKVIGTVLYFTFTKPAEEIGKYLTYCTPAPQIVLANISTTACPIAMLQQPGRAHN